MVNLKDNGFLIKDVFLLYLNEMSKSRNIVLDIDKELNAESNIVGMYKDIKNQRK
jgi:hypothetical protein